MRFTLFLSIVFFGLTSCEKEDSSPAPVNNQNPPVFQSPKKIYIDGKLDTASFSLVAGRKSYNQDLNVMSSSFGNQQKLYTSNTIAKNDDIFNETFNSPNMKIEFLLKYDPNPRNYEAQIDKMYIGNKSYGSDDIDYSTAKEGVIISTYDDDGLYWSTELGAQNISTSSFRVEELDTLYFDTFQIQTPNVLLKGKFNCILYDSTGNSKMLTNGDFALEFGLY